MRFKNWLIHKLGGWTRREYQILTDFNTTILREQEDLREKLKANK